MSKFNERERARAAALYQRFATLVQARARRLLGDAATAADVTHEVFVKLIEYERKHGPVSHESAFLYRTTTNLAINLYHGTRRRLALLQRSTPPPQPALAPDVALALRHVLQKVDAELAQVAVFYYVDGMTQEEIADLLELSRRTVFQRLQDFCAAAARLLDSSPAGATAPVLPLPRRPTS